MQMGNKVLVAYASKYGATAEIAEKIGQVINQAGLQVDVLPVKSVKELKLYQAVVLGSAAYMFRWRPEAVSFLKKNKGLLAELPTWLFSSGPLGKGDPVQLLKGQRFPKALQPIIEAVRPRDIAVFHGFIDMKKLNFFERFAFKKATDLQGDFRDWDAIISWANAIADTLNK
jgi:menaquinone-dependent protoporphyrinogen oxidase